MWDPQVERALCLPSELWVLKVNKMTPKEISNKEKIIMQKDPLLADTKMTKICVSVQARKQVTQEVIDGIGATKQQMHNEYNLYGRMQEAPCPSHPYQNSTEPPVHDR